MKECNSSILQTNKQIKWYSTPTKIFSKHAKTVVAVAAWGAEDLHGGLGGSSPPTSPRTMDIFLRPPLFLGRNDEGGEEGEKENEPPLYILARFALAFFIPLLKIRSSKG